jgi:hypothetical protein
LPAAAAGELDEAPPVAELAAAGVLLELLELLLHAARASGTTAATTAMPATRAEYRYAI